MRKFIALALVVAMMLVLVPTAFAVVGTTNVISNTYTYYVGVNDKGNSPVTTLGGIAYVAEKFGNFVSWQIPGNALTGNALSWGPWIQVDATIFVEGYAGKSVYIDGQKYDVKADGTFDITFYTLPVAGGNQVTRTLALYDANSKWISYATVAMIYQDIYTQTGSVTTEGINQPNTYATIVDGDIVVDCVFNNLVPVTVSSNPNNAGYTVPSYYPVRVKLTLTDKDGNKYPAFTRVDSIKNSPSDLVFYVGASQVPNGGLFYLTETSEISIEKRFSAKGTALTSLDIYVETAKKFAGYNEVGSALRNTLGATSQPFTALPYGFLTNFTALGQPFNELHFASWNTECVRSSNQANEPIAETSIKNAIDRAILAYYADPFNAEVYKQTAPFDYPIGNYAISATADGLVTLLDAVEDFYDIIDPTYVVRGSAHADLDTDAERGDFISDFYEAITTGAATNATIATPAALRALYETYVDDVLVKAPINYGMMGWEAEYLNQAALNLPTADFALLNAPIINALPAMVNGSFNYRDVGGVLNYYTWKDDVYAYRDRINVANQSVLQPNANIFGNLIDNITMTLTTPAGQQSVRTFTIKYNSVSRIVAKALTVLEGTTITIKVGEKKNVTVNAYQNQVPVTGLPIKFTSNDTNIATATSPNTQGVNTNTTEIEGKAIGQTIVRAYLDTTNDKAETFIIVNVVADTATPAATTPYVCKVRKLFVRTGPGTSYDKVSSLARNDVINVIEVVNGWAKWEFNGQTVYSSLGNGKYLQPK